MLIESHRRQPGASGPPRNSFPESPALFAAQNSSLIERLYQRAGAARWQLSRDLFAEALYRSAAKRFVGRAPGAGALEQYLGALELEDLALACACCAAHEQAWEFFVARYRSELRAAARAILRASGSADEARAEELADSLYADLYGVGTTGAVRQRSLFEYFHGRSKLSTWLRSLLAQRHVDALRAGRRDAPPDDAASHSSQPPDRCVEPDPDRQRYLASFDVALAATLAELDSRDRLRLAFFYLDQRTLAEIGRALGEHESTASRQLERTRSRLRERVTELLSRGGRAIGGPVDGPGLDAAQIELAFKYALEDSPLDLSRALSEAPSEQRSEGEAGLRLERETP